jgi:hypothetical protein
MLQTILNNLIKKIGLRIDIDNIFHQSKMFMKFLIDTNDFEIYAVFKILPFFLEIHIQIALTVEHVFFSTN